MKYHLCNNDSSSEIEISHENFSFMITIDFKLIGDFELFGEMLNSFINKSNDSPKNTSPIQIGTLQIDLDGGYHMCFNTTDFSFQHVIYNNSKTQELVAFLRDNFNHFAGASTFKPASFETEVV